MSARLPNEGPAQEEPLLTAARLLAWRRQGLKTSPAPLPEAAILTHQGVLTPKRRPWRKASFAGLFSFEAHTLAGGALTLAALRSVGAPATAIAIEELATSGVRRLIAVDIGASIDPSVRTGDVMLLDAALVADGTSPHYTTEHVVAADQSLTRRLAERLTAAGIPHTAGRAWSTDAVYRETPSQLENARRQAAVLADMETASVFAVARVVRIEAAAVLVAADELHDGWRPPTSMSHVNATLRSLFDVATACLLP